MTIDQYRKQWLRWRRVYERKGFTICRKAIRKTAQGINLELINENNYETVIRSGITNVDIFNAYYDFYRVIGEQHGRRIMRDIRNQEKDLFSDAFNRQLISFLTNFAGSRIRSVTDTLADYIINQITDGLNDNLTIREIVSGIVQKRSFYRWQILRIVRTETTAAAGYAADVASSTSGIVLEKVWVSATDPRTRVVPEDSFDHLSMNQVRVADGQLFEVPRKTGGVELMRFPGDPNAGAGNVVNCRCSMIKVAKRDENGRIVRL